VRHGLDPLLSESFRRLKGAICAKFM